MIEKVISKMGHREVKRVRLREREGRKWVEDTCRDRRITGRKERK